jgi:hypothetical protein
MGHAVYRYSRLPYGLRFSYDLATSAASNELHATGTINVRLSASGVKEFFAVIFRKAVWRPVI